MKEKQLKKLHFMLKEARGNLKQLSLLLSKKGIDTTDFLTAKTIMANVGVLLQVENHLYLLSKED